MRKGTRQALRVTACSLVLAGAACERDIAGPAAAPALSNAALHSMSDGEQKTTGDEMDLTLQVAIAVTDAAERAGVAEDAVTVKEARVVNWASSAVGCPKDGMNYMQVIVPGVLLILEVEGRIYRYHGEANRQPFYCPAGRAQAPAYGQGKEFM